MDIFDQMLNLISMSILVSSFALAGSKRIMTYIRAFRVQAALLACIAAMYTVRTLIEEKRLEGVVVILILILVLKVIYIPNMLLRISQKVKYKVEKDFFVNIPLSILICGGIVVLSWFVVASIPELRDVQTNSFMIQSISVVLIGLFFMFSRKKAIGQIIGFLVIENGVFMAAMLLTSGMPLIVEFGVFFDMLTAAIIMGVMVFKINETFDHIDINKLRNLRG